MTLMEAVVALVILALVAVGCLELSDSASRLEYSATQWNKAVTVAESRMAQVVTQAPQMSAGEGYKISAGDSIMQAGIRVSRQPWRRGLDVISVAVPVEGAKQYVLRRVVPSVDTRALGVR